MQTMTPKDQATQWGWFQTGPRASGGQGHTVGSGGQGHTVGVVPDMCYGFRWAEPHSVGGSRQVL